MLELEAEAILQKMTVDEVREAAKIGIMWTLITTRKAITAVKKLIKEEAENGKIQYPEHEIF